MIIALDFDNTYTRDPELWYSFTNYSRMRGHTVILVTARFDQHMAEVKTRVDGIFSASQIFNTSMAPKREFMQSKRVSVDIWIDDCPEMI